ncbi:hypothetical protein GQ43DRAFT_462479 [Delitschia confertaspora ATCC 74209]|uniref:WD40 repeat-like protein n=1 Tax=Delitschia confertaspora ATCC 74209 TaxID=1513339 RepID=A0A9P4MWM2_9PLEO|nr:hypothetical protein GQ43DRAFT_462479 [Delitschia confertaspora ATCC 74209]
METEKEGCQALFSPAVSCSHTGSQGGATRFTSRGRQHIPKLKEWRCNLTALSQVYNLYFLAVADELYVYQPNFPDQFLADEPELIVKPPVSRPNLTPHPGIDRQCPHSITRLHVDFLGNEEIILIACDDGDVAAYKTAHIQYALEKHLARADEQNDDEPHANIRPYFHRNFTLSAWGLAVHREARLIAVSSNTRRVTVLAFALTRKAGSVSASSTSSIHTLGEPTDQKQSFPHDRATLTVITLHIGATQNIPSVSFDNSGADPEGRWLLSNMIDGNVFLWDLHNPGLPARRMRLGFCAGPLNHQLLRNTCACPDMRSYPHAAWGAIFIDPRSCLKCETVQEAFGSGNLEEDNFFYDITPKQNTPTNTNTFLHSNNSNTNSQQISNNPGINVPQISTNSETNAQQVSNNPSTNPQPFANNPATHAQQDSTNIQQGSTNDPPIPSNTSTNLQPASNQSFAQLLAQLVADEDESEDDDEDMLDEDEENEFFEQQVHATINNSLGAVQPPTEAPVTTVSVHPANPGPPSALAVQNQTTPASTVPAMSNLGNAISLFLGEDDEEDDDDEMDDLDDIDDADLIHVLQTQYHPATPAPPNLLKKPFFDRNHPRPASGSRLGPNRELLNTPPETPIMIINKADVCLLQPLGPKNDFEGQPIIAMRNPQLTVHDQTSPFWDRLCFVLQIPELGVVIVGTPVGKVCILTLTRTRVNKKTIFGYRYDPKTDLLPYVEEGKEFPGLGVGGNVLVGVAASPVQGNQLGDERWRLMLHFSDHTMLSYELERTRGDLETRMEEIVV